MADFTYYEPGTPFPGTIGRTLDTSVEAWPSKPQPPDGAPNVVIILLDDVGYGQLSPFGGLIDTPNLDRLADRGLRYANFQTTALCSPTRGSLLTGRNHHRLGLSAITELSMGFPAHNGTMSAEHGMLSEILVERGYNTFAIGKWHLTPPEETSPAGPFVRWPLGRGFERYYGFLGGDTDQFHPDLVHDNHWVPQPSQPADGYHLNVDLADHAIDCIKDAHNNAPDKPFLLYFCPGAGHAPHQVEQEWIDRYAGAFDMGWDEYRRQVFQRQLDAGIIPPHTELSERDPDVPAWDSLSDDAKRMCARQMEVYAGFLSQTDHHIGRILDFIESIGELDDTLVLFMCDNGASAEGGVEGSRNEGLFFNLAPETLEDNLAVYDVWGSEDTFNHYAWGWAWAGDTPFRRWKRETYRGGVTDALIVSWPSRIDDQGGVRQQYTHVTDITPTILDLLGIEPPDVIRGVPQSTMDGVSFAPTLVDADAPSEHHVQLAEMFGHRAIYADGWKAVCPYPGPSLIEGVEKGHPFGTPITEDLLATLDAEDWELYHLDADPAECHDLAAEQSDKLAELVDLWWSEAERNEALPLVVGLTRLLARRPRLGGHGKTFDFLPGGSPIPFAATPRVAGRSHSFTAHVDIPDEGADGVLLVQGNRHGGYAFSVADGHLHFTYNYLGLDRWTVSSQTPVPAGAHRLRVEVVLVGEPAGPGKGRPAEVRLYIDDVPAGFGELPWTVPNLFAIVGVSCGFAAYDTVDPDRFLAPFPFTGDLTHVRLDVSGDLVIDEVAEFRRLMAQQ